VEATIVGRDEVEAGRAAVGLDHGDLGGGLEQPPAAGGRQQFDGLVRAEKKPGGGVAQVVADFRHAGVGLESRRPAGHRVTRHEAAQALSGAGVEHAVVADERPGGADGEGVALVEDAEPRAEIEPQEAVGGGEPEAAVGVEGGIEDRGVGEPGPGVERLGALQCRVGDDHAAVVAPDKDRASVRQAQAPHQRPGQQRRERGGKRLQPAGGQAEGENAFAVDQAERVGGVALDQFELAADEVAAGVDRTEAVRPVHQQPAAHILEVDPAADGEKPRSAGGGQGQEVGPVAGEVEHAVAGGGEDAGAARDHAAQPAEGARGRGQQVRVRGIAELAVGRIRGDHAELVVAAGPEHAVVIPAQRRHVGGRHGYLLVRHAVEEDRGVIGAKHRETLGGVGDRGDPAETVVVVGGK
jgi:hypothetical protein